MCTRRTPACSVGPPPAPRNPRLSEQPLDLLAAPDPVAAFLDAHAAGRAVALRTSGSTGTPRVVVRSTDSWVRSFPAVTELAGLDQTSAVWVPGPIAATMNLFAAVHAAYAGVRTVDAPEPATHAVLTPAALDTALAGLLPGTTVVVAGDRLSPALHDRAVAAGLQVHHYYGAAELSFVAWGPHAEALTLFPGVEARVESGEIWVRSPYLCTSYDGQPGPLRRAPDGFATVGDRGTLHHARLRVLGRPGAVTTAGATVDVAAVEDVLARRASGQVAVVGVPHPRLGSVLAGVVTDPTDRELLPGVAREVLPPASRPRAWLHLERLPLTGAGKVDRAVLERLLDERAGQDGGRLAWGTP